MTDCPSYDRDPEQPDRCLVDAFEPAAKGADEPFMILGNNAVPYSFEGIVFYTFRDASYFSRPHHGFDDFPDSVRDKYFDQLIPKVENLLESPIPLLEQQEKLHPDEAPVEHPDYLKAYVTMALGANMAEYKNEPPGCQYTQHPLETLQLGTADCEDYALLYYDVLKQLGVAEENLYLMQGFARLTNYTDEQYRLDQAAGLSVPLKMDGQYYQSHAALMMKTEHGDYFLDSLKDRPMKAEDYANDFIPTYIVGGTEGHYKSYHVENPDLNVPRNRIVDILFKDHEKRAKASKKHNADQGSSHAPDTPPPQAEPVSCKPVNSR
ncbi:MAG: hypothetical protein KDI46_08095 [Alphaproteobacteria bacterium]|nr:hypothetical protein [Alphaproteobacteria bacterium]